MAEGARRAVVGGLNQSGALEFFKLLLGALLTLAVGIAALLLTKLFVDPLNEQKKIIAEIASAMFYWARVYANPNLITPQSSDTGTAERELRSLAGKLVAATDSVRPYRLGRWLGAPSLDAVSKAARNLIVIANGLHDPGSGSRNYSCANEALECLCVKARVTGVIPKSG